MGIIVVFGAIVAEGDFVADVVADLVDEAEIKGVPEMVAEVVGVRSQVFSVQEIVKSSPQVQVLQPSVAENV